MQPEFRINLSWKRGLSMLLLTLFSFSVALAQVLVRGTVVDQTGESVPGASIQVKGGTQGTISDLDGKFSLNVPNKKSTLVISFIGYITQEVPTDASKPMSVVLKEDTKTLDEVVIVGYGQQKKASVVGAIAQVSTKELSQSPVSNVSNALAGRLPGMITVQRSGEPGSDMANMYIRGISTFGSNQSPLV